MSKADGQEPIGPETKIPVALGRLLAYDLAARKARHLLTDIMHVHDILDLHEWPPFNDLEGYQNGRDESGRLAMRVNYLCKLLDFRNVEQVESEEEQEHAAS